MRPRPPMTYSLARHRPVAPGQDLWLQNLPDNRFGDTTQTDRLTYGQYFQAVGDFLCADDLTAVCRAAGQQVNTDIQPGDIQSIDVSLEKHGQYTHPARVRVDLEDRRAVLGVNVAVTPAGRSCLTEDVRLLDRLGTAFPYRFLPAVYRWQTLRRPDLRHPITLALCEWLDPYCEFHLTGPTAAGGTSVALWHPTGGRQRLSPRQAAAVFRHMAMVLTAYYNVDTCEHVAAWHLAAGDFVARTEAASPDVRLITVRRYTPLLESVPPDSESAFHGAVLFFLKTSLRLRLDRIDGVGPMAWVGDDLAGPMVEGFFDGLRLQVQAGRLPPVFAELMRSHLALLPQSDLAALVEAVVPHSGLSEEERALVDPRLADHAAAFNKALQRGGRGRGAWDGDA